MGVGSCLHQSIQHPIQACPSPPPPQNKATNGLTNHPLIFTIQQPPNLSTQQPIHPTTQPPPHPTKTAPTSSSSPPRASPPRARGARRSSSSPRRSASGWVRVD